MTNSSSRFSPLLLAAALLVPASAAAADAYPPTTTEAEVRALVQSLELPRPRLLVSPGEWDRLRERVRREPGLAAIAARVRRDADAMLGIEPVKRELEGRRLLNESRRALRRLLTLSLAHVLTHDSKYVDRAAREMRAVAEFSDWNPTHFLDVAEMTLALALGYDWLHGQLDEPTRNAARAAILAKGVRVPLDTPHHRWTANTNNWGQVCHAGMVAGALGRSFGVDQAPGFDQTGAFLALTTGPSRLVFNFADGSAGRWVEPAVHSFAARYRRPEWLLADAPALQRELATPGNPASAGNRFLPFMLLWSRGDTGADYSRLPLHWTGDGPVPIALHRSSWTDPGAVFVGLKAGSPAGPHGQMDTGSFVLDADGQRWAVDLGAENYHLVETHKATRWSVFRHGNFSHNTLVIGDALQVPVGRTRIARFSDDATFPHSVVDLSPVYAGQAASAHRGIALLPDGRVLIRDHLTGLTPGFAVRWGMMTHALPGGPGADRLELRQRNSTARLRIHEPAGATWTLTDASKPREPWDWPNPGAVMAAFTVRAPDSGTLDLAVVFTPGSRAGSAATRLPAEPPLHWSFPR